MGRVLGTLLKETKRASQELSNAKMNSQIDTLLGRETRASARTAAKKQGQSPVQTPLEILRNQLAQDNRARARVATAKAQQVIDSSAGVQAKAMAKQGAEDKAFARDFVRGKSDIAAEQTRTKAAAIDSQNAAARLEAQQLSEASANGGSFIDQVSRDVDQARAAAKARAISGKDLKNASLAIGSTAGAAALALHGFDSAAGDVQDMSGVSSVVSPTHVTAKIVNGVLVDGNGKPIDDKTLASLSSAGQVSVVQDRKDVGKKPVGTIQARQQAISVVPNGSEIIIDGRTINREQVQADNGVTIITAAEAKAQGIDNPGNSDLLYMTSNSGVKFGGGTGVDSTKIITSNLSKPIAEYTKNIVAMQNGLDQEATNRATEVISNDPVIQEAMATYDQLDSIEQASIDNSLRTYRDKEKSKALIAMAREPDYAQQMDEIKLLKGTQLNMMAAQATVDSQPELVSIFNAMVPASEGNTELLTSIMKVGTFKDIALKYQLAGRVEGIDAYMDKGAREAAISLASNTSSGQPEVSQNIANIMADAGDAATQDTQIQIRALTGEAALQMSKLKGAKEKAAYIKGLYSKNFRTRITSQIGSTLLATSGLSPKFGEAVFAYGLDSPGKVIESLLKGKKLDDAGSAKILKFAGELKGINVRVRQLYDTHEIIASSGVSVADINNQITQFANTLVQQATPAPKRDLLAEAVVGVGTRLGQQFAPFGGFLDASK